MPTSQRELLIAEAVRDLAGHADDTNPVELLHGLAAHVVALLPVRASGVTVRDPLGQVDYLAASDETCRRLEQDQIDLDQGPCVDSTRGGSVLSPVALRGEGQRWPRFAVRALSAGITSVGAVPLRSRDDTFGAVSLMITTPSMPTGHDLRLAQTLAGTAATCLRQRQALLGKDTLIGHLQIALDSRIVIEQAKGVLSARLRISPEEAFTRLRAHARNRSRRLRDLAAQVVRGSIPPELDPER